eukprot:9422199-Ditylum_brightwellii.AAC.1
MGDILLDYDLVSMDENDALIIDTGASQSATFCTSDFISSIHPPSLDTLVGLSEKSQACVCLFSPQKYFQENDLGTASFDKDAFTFCFASRHQSTLTLRNSRHVTLKGATIGEAIELVVDNWNVRLTSNEKLLLYWHYKLGHFFLAWIQALMRKGKNGQPPVILTPKTSRAHCCDLSGLLCASCQLGKGARASSGARHTTDVKPRALK